MTRARATAARLALLLLIGPLAVFHEVSVSAQKITFAAVGSIAGPADMVKVKDLFAYVVNDKSLTVVDISSPAMPRRRGSYEFPEKIWGFWIAGSDIYVAADLYGVGILDVSNPDAPTLKGSFKTRGQAKGVASLGTKVVVADHMSGVELIDVSNIAQPKREAAFFLDGYARDIVIAGSTAYAVDSPQGFYVFDLTRQGPFESVGSLQAGNSYGAQVMVAADSASTVVGVSGGRGGFEVFDVSNPAAPTLAASVTTPSGQPGRTVVHNRLAYVADGGAGLQVVDLSIPSKPVIIGSYKTATPARDVAVAGSLIFVVATDETVILRRIG